MEYEFALHNEEIYIDVYHIKSITRFLEENLQYRGLKWK